MVYVTLSEYFLITVILNSKDMGILEILLILNATCILCLNDIFFSFSSKLLQRLENTLKILLLPFVWITDIKEKIKTKKMQLCKF